MKSRAELHEKVGIREKIAMTLQAWAEKLERKNQTPSGAEIPDPEPMELPIGYVNTPSMADHIREIIRSEKLRQEMMNAGVETFDEANDFDVEDDLFPVSDFENIGNDLDGADDGAGPTQKKGPATSPPPSGADDGEGPNENPAAGAAGNKKMPIPVDDDDFGTDRN